VPADALVGPWIEAHLRVNDLKGARAVVETCSKALGIGGLGPNWTWDQAISKSDKLSRLGLSVLYMLDEHCSPPIGA